jgi:hypothetical protein
LAKTLCELANSMPVVIGALLDREARLIRGRFREETLTDLLVASLAAFAGPDLIIQYPDEPTSGGDVDLEFWHVEDGRRLLLLRLQAKRLNAAVKGGKPVAIQHRAYEELLHQVASTGEYQFKTLTSSGDPHLPLYMFYNHASVVAHPYHAAKYPPISGINLAFADDIAGELQLKLNATLEKKPRRLHHKRLHHLQPHFFGLKEILCPGGKVQGEVPTPDAVSDALQTHWRRPRPAKTQQEQDEDLVLRYLLEPPAVRPDRNPRRRLPDGPAIRTSNEVERDTVTFVSGRTADDRTPKIHTATDRRD